MKLERLFEVKESKLYKIGEDGEYKANARAVKWSEVEGNPEEYNEEFLAKLRDELKLLEEKNEFVFIEAVFDKDADYEQFTAAMKHTARRIKDCVSVIGFSIPNELFDDKDPAKSVYGVCGSIFSRYVVRVHFNGDFSPLFHLIIYIDGLE